VLQSAFRDEMFERCNAKTQGLSAQSSGLSWVFPIFSPAIGYAIRLAAIEKPDVRPLPA